MLRWTPDVYCRGLSITRLEGSRWCLRRTRWVMEKVEECGLMWLGDEGVQEQKIGGEGRCVRGRYEIFEGIDATVGRILDSERRVDTHRHGRAAARRESPGLQSSLRRIGKTFRNKSPCNLGGGQSFDESHGRLTGRTAPRRTGRSCF
jgi:hypothetical protein